VRGTVQVRPVIAAPRRVASRDHPLIEDHVFLADDPDVRGTELPGQRLVPADVLEE
jgi:hypothetical protein